MDQYLRIESEQPMFVCLKQFTFGHLLRTFLPFQEELKIFHIKLDQHNIMWLGYNDLADILNNFKSISKRKSNVIFFDIFFIFITLYVRRFLYFLFVCFLL